MRPIPIKREKFAKEYLIDLNGTRAAIRAGYAPKHADTEAVRLLGDAKVKAIIETEQAKLAARCDIQKEELIRLLRRRAHANMADFTRIVGDRPVLDFTGVTREKMAAVQEISEDTTGGRGDGERKLVLRTKVKICNPDQAIELLARMSGLLIDRTKHEGSVDLTGASDEELEARRKKLLGLP